MENWDRVVAVRKGDKKLFVIKIFRKGNAAMKYVFGKNGERELPKLITREEADALIDKILEKQVESKVQVLGDTSENAKLQALELNGRITL